MNEEMSSREVGLLAFLSLLNGGLWIAFDCWWSLAVALLCVGAIVFIVAFESWWHR